MVCLLNKNSQIIVVSTLRFSRMLCFLKCYSVSKIKSMGGTKFSFYLDKGPFKYYVSNGMGGWVKKLAIFCLLTVHREWVDGLENPPKHAYVIFEWSLINIFSFQFHSCRILVLPRVESKNHQRCRS